MNRFEVKIILISTLVIAISSIVYELLIGAIASYFLGNSVYQFSITIGIFMFSAGLGSFLSSSIKRNEIYNFILTEILISFIGGCSALILMWAFAYTRVYSVVMFIILILIGILTGLEIPLLIRILKNYFDLKITVSQILAFDYLGALIGSVVFPLLMLPYLGIGLTGIVMGLFNICIAITNAFVFKDILKTKSYIKWVTITVFAILFIIGINVSKLTIRFTGKLYQNTIIWSKQTKYQNVVLTKFKEDYRMIIDGNLQFSSLDEYRYHEVLVHPVMSLVPGEKHVLILGGGDGLALREVLKYPEVKSVRLVDIDKEIVSICKENVVMQKLNQNSLSSPKLEIVIDDAYKFLERDDRFYNVVIIDLPDPNNYSLSKLYSQEFYRLLSHRLSADGIIITQSTSPFLSNDAFSCIHQTLKSIFEYVVPLNTYVPTFGLWGFNMASARKIDPGEIQLNVPTRYLDEDVVPTLFIFSPDTKIKEVEINRIHSPVLQMYYWNNWKKWRG
ncbi:MAG: polyamine aminopropyltransferase [bacterium]|nr:polyamine aminopropyltransferase [bacterium]